MVRKILRRAMVDRHRLGGDLRKPWLAELAGVTADAMSNAWPDISERSAAIQSSIAAEEERFATSFLSATQRLEVMTEAARNAGLSVFPPDDSFLLYDTFGLPLDIQKMMLEAEGLTVDEEGYRASMGEQRQRSREETQLSDAIFDEGPLKDVAGDLPPTTFLSETPVAECTLLAIVGEEGEEEAEGVLVVLDQTPFYAEGGGQIGDRGRIEGEGWSVTVDDTVELRGIHLHRGAVTEGAPTPGPCQAAIDQDKRDATARHHTATHLLHQSLRAVLGDDVVQAGSLVTPDRLRFDFRFPRAMTDGEVMRVEENVNQWALSNAPVNAEIMDREAAREVGAMALFGEKYGDTVRVVSVSNPGGEQNSVELCGGSHVRRSGDIGAFRVISEGSIAAGIRRIEARAGMSVIQHSRSADALLEKSSELLKTSPQELETRIQSLQTELKQAQKTLGAALSEQADARLQDCSGTWNGLPSTVGVLEGVPSKSLREIATGQVQGGSELVLIAVPESEATHYVAAMGKGAQSQGFTARDLVEQVGKALKGKGGGSPALAQGRGEHTEELSRVLAEILDAFTPSAEG